MEALRRSKNPALRRRSFSSALLLKQLDHAVTLSEKDSHSVFKESAKRLP